jgi:hypothetical protein
MKPDQWQRAAKARLQSHLMRGTMRGRNYSPDQTYDLSKRGHCGPHSACIAEIMQRWADMWAQDMREAEASALDVDAGAQWLANMREADAEVDRYLNANKLTRAA